MKKVISLSMVCLMALSICAVFSCTKNDNETNDGNEPGGGGNTEVYVDLGLPSGTKWKTTNEENVADVNYGFFTYDEAVSKFGIHNLPSKIQLEELKSECQWSWTGSGYAVTGPNGNSIYLPAMGFRNDEGQAGGVGTRGQYWSSSLYNSERPWILYFGSTFLYIEKTSTRYYGGSVRLVKN